MLKKEFTLASVSFDRSAWANKNPKLIDRLHIQIDGGPGHTYCHATLEWKRYNNNHVFLTCQVFDDGFNDLMHELVEVLKPMHVRRDMNNPIMPEQAVKLLSKSGFAPSSSHGKLEVAEKS
jgi:hypothetical protein